MLTERSPLLLFFVEFTSDRRLSSFGSLCCWASSQYSPYRLFSGQESCFSSLRRLSAPNNLPFLFLPNIFLCKNFLYVSSFRLLLFAPCLSAAWVRKTALTLFRPVRPFTAHCEHRCFSLRPFSLFFSFSLLSMRAFCLSAKFSLSSAHFSALFPSTKNSLPPFPCSPHLPSPFPQSPFTVM